MGAAKVLIEHESIHIDNDIVANCLLAHQPEILAMLLDSDKTDPTSAVVNKWRYCYAAELRVILACRRLDVSKLSINFSEAAPIHIDILLDDGRFDPFLVNSSYNGIYLF